jgi:hypothetical protein
MTNITEKEVLEFLKNKPYHWKEGFYLSIQGKEMTPEMAPPKEADLNQWLAGAFFGLTFWT